MFKLFLIRKFFLIEKKTKKMSALFPLTIFTARWFIAVEFLNSSQTNLPLKRQPHKMVKNTQTIYRLLPTNCLSIFDHFVGLALTGLKLKRASFSIFVNFPYCECKHFVKPLTIFLTLLQNLSLQITS